MFEGSLEMLCHVAQAAHGTPDYEEIVALRHAVLRAPLGLHFTPEQLTAEVGSCHLGCWCGEILAGCLLLQPKDTGRVQMRQVAVRDGWQGRGIGRLLVKYAEERAQEQGFDSVVLHARESAIGFYEKLEYKKQGIRFYEIGLPHWEMIKRIN